MPRRRARFRISIKDSLTGASLKIELVESANLNRFRIRQNGLPAQRVQNATLSTVFSSLGRQTAGTVYRAERGQLLTMVTRKGAGAALRAASRPISLVPSSCDEFAILDDQLPCMLV